MTWLEQPFPPVCPAPALLEPLTVYALPGQPNTWLLTLTGPDQGALSYGGLHGTVYPVVRQNGELHVSLYRDQFLLMDESGKVNAGLLGRLRAQEADFLPLDMRFQSDVDGLDPPNECAWLLPTAEKPLVAVVKTRTLGYSFDEDGLYEVMLNLHGNKKVRGMIREFPLYDMSERTLGTALWVRLADRSRAMLHNAHTGFFDDKVYQRVLYDTPPLAVPTGKRTTVAADEALAPSEELPPLLFLTQMVSKYAKVPPDGVSRRALYQLKDTLMETLYAQGLIVPEVILTSPWEFASDLQGWGHVLADALPDAFPDDEEDESGRPGEESPWGPVPPTTEEAQAWLDAIVQDAERTGEPLTVSVFEERSVWMMDLPLRYGRFQREWEDLSPRQLEQLHPRGNWLVGFGTPDDPGRETLHIPYLTAIRWLKRLPERTAPRKAELYGEPPTDEQEEAWPLERVLRHVGYDLRHPTFKHERYR